MVHRERLQPIPSGSSSYGFTAGKLPAESRSCYRWRYGNAARCTPPQLSKEFPAGGKPVSLGQSAYVGWPDKAKCPSKLRKAATFGSIVQPGKIRRCHTCPSGRSRDTDKYGRRSMVPLVAALARPQTQVAGWPGQGRVLASGRDRRDPLAVVRVLGLSPTVRLYVPFRHGHVITARSISARS